MVRFIVRACARKKLHDVGNNLLTTSRGLQEVTVVLELIALNEMPVASCSNLSDFEILPFHHYKGCSSLKSPSLTVTSTTNQL